MQYKASTTVKTFLHNENCFSIKIGKIDITKNVMDEYSYR